MYNSLIMAYCKKNEALNAEKVLKEMELAGLKADEVSYTTVIDAYKRESNFPRCWELYDQFRFAGGEPDEFMYSFMVRLCASTHDAEQALKIYRQMEARGFLATAPNYNSIIFALGSRKMYANDAITIWRKMQGEEVIPDRHTCIGVLKACAKIGDVNTANDVL